MNLLREYLREYALLIAVAMPVLVIVATNAWLMLSGESGTLLLPRSRPFSPVAPFAAMVTLASTISVAASREAGKLAVEVERRLMQADRRFPPRGETPRRREPDDSAVGTRPAYA